MIGVNEYFDGKVKSLAFETSDGKQTLGVMAPGEYTFDTSAPEVVRVVAGVLTVKLPGASEWIDVGPGESFSVDAGKAFDLKVAAPAGYLCSYG